VPVRLFVGNLPYSATDVELRAHFSQVGEPSGVVMPVDRDTGRPRGFAFVDFADRGVAEEIIRRFNGQPFKGRTLAVSEARAREDRPGPRPAGGFAPRPPRPMGSGPIEPLPSAPRGDRSNRNFGPDAPPRGKRGPKAQYGKADRGPKGPLRERTPSRVLDIFAGDDEGETPEFENFATSTQKDDEEQES
jgi:RNA recognition motif-containing protein